jgi:hypothetical protein
LDLLLLLLLRRRRSDPPPPDRRTLLARSEKSATTHRRRTGNISISARLLRPARGIVGHGVSIVTSPARLHAPARALVHALRRERTTLRVRGIALRREEASPEAEEEAEARVRGRGIVIVHPATTPARALATTVLSPVPTTVVVPFPTPTRALLPRRCTSPFATLPAPASVSLLLCPGSMRAGRTRWRESMAGITERSTSMRRQRCTRSSHRAVREGSTRITFIRRTEAIRTRASLPSPVHVRSRSTLPRHPPTLEEVAVVLLTACPHPSRRRRPTPCAVRVRTRITRERSAPSEQEEGRSIRTLSSSMRGAEHTEARTATLVHPPPHPPLLPRRSLPLPPPPASARLPFACTLRRVSTKVRPSKKSAQASRPSRCGPARGICTRNPSLRT